MGLQQLSHDFAGNERLGYAFGYLVQLRWSARAE
jgi:hypothetical protein